MAGEIARERIGRETIPELGDVCRPGCARHEMTVDRADYTLQRTGARTQPSTMANVPPTCRIRVRMPMNLAIVRRASLFGPGPAVT